MNFYFNDIAFIRFISLVWAIFSCIMGIFVYFKNRHSIINRIWSGVSFGVGFWCLGAYFLLTSKDYAGALFAARFLHFFAIPIPIVQLHFTYLLLAIPKNQQRFLRSGYLVTIILLLSDFTPFFIREVVTKPYFRYYPVPCLLYHIFTIMYFGISIYWSYLLIKAIPGLTSGKRNQIKYVAIASIIGIFGGGTTFLLIYNIPFPPFPALLVALYPLIITYAIIKYRLMDINIALTRAGVFIAVYALVLGVPLWLGYTTKAWFPATGLAILLATLGPLIYNYFRRRAEDIVLKDQHRYQETLRRLSATLTLVKELERLLKLVVLRVARAVRVDFACVYLANENKLIQKYPYTVKGFFPDFPKELSFDSNVIRYTISKRKPVFAEELVSMTDGFNLRSGLIVPSFVRKRLLGFLVLGPKASGAIYTQEDANMFGILANQLVLAIENSQFIDEHERTQAELFSRERMASLGTMAGGMTHQINNRFNAISMATSDTIDTLKFIDPNSCSQEAKEYLQQIKHALVRIQENALRGGKLVNDFLNFSQPDRLQKETKLFNLPEPLERGIEMVKIKTAFSQDTIQKEIPESPLLIRGSFEMLQDMFFNITDNAIDALDKKDKAIQKKELTPPEEGYKGRVAIRMYREDPWVVSKIQDNGIGMTKEQLGRLFVPFFTTKATAVKGTGFGFFVIYKIIEAHGGTIEVESEYGKGTTFTIKLPLAKKGEENNEP